MIRIVKKISNFIFNFYFLILPCLDPFILPHMQVDKGAIRFVLSGANIMCPGLTSPGARMTKVDKDQIVVSLPLYLSINIFNNLTKQKIFIT